MKNGVKTVRRKKAPCAWRCAQEIVECHWLCLALPVLFPGKRDHINSEFLIHSSTQFSLPIFNFRRSILTGTRHPTNRLAQFLNSRSDGDRSSLAPSHVFQSNS